MYKKQLNLRQRKFAAAVAAGKTQAEAYREAGYETNGSAKSTVTRNAQVLRQKPAIKRAIEELQVQLVPPQMLAAPEDLAAAYGHGIARVVQLSNEAKEERVRLEAAKFLVLEMRGAMEAKRERDSKKVRGSEEVIAELRALYRRELPPIVEEVKSEEPAIEGEAEPNEPEENNRG